MSPSPGPVNHDPARPLTFALLCGCFALSGVAALVYQAAWTRQFAIVFGTSELAVATVLAGYMGGLALGAALVDRLLPRIARPVFTFALLELGIAAAAVLAVPALLWAADHGLVLLFGAQPAPPDSEHAGTTLFYSLSAFVALALPTALMGATLPLLARYVVTVDDQIGRRIGLLYAVNTSGAVLGALFATFALLPEFGLQKTIWFGAALNAMACLLALALAQRITPRAPPGGYSLDAPVSIPAPAPRRSSFRQLPGPAWVLPLMLAAGAVAFYQEVLWTRMLAHIVGSSVYAFGVMVASFLAGIALGGVVGAGLARSRQRAAAALGGALLVAAAGAALAYVCMPELLPDTAGLRRVRSVAGVDLPVNALLGGLLLLPMTLAIGATYPLAVRVLAADADDAASASARVYAWNTVGAILGALAAGFVLIPMLRYEGALRVAVIASAALGVLALWILVPLARIAAAGVSIAALACCVLFAPRAPMKLLLTSPLNVGDDGRVLHYAVGRSASVVLLAEEGGLELRTNGLPEALIDGPGALPRFSGEHWMSPLAVIARPAARHMLIVGLGGGVSVEAVPPSVQRVDVIEIEPEVIEANRVAAPLRRRNPLADPRVNLIINDARGALRLTDSRYDVIVSQPSHPWTAGASHLYTREFMSLAREHLAPEGVFVQWMNVRFLDEDLLRSLTATLLSVFQEIRAYRPDPETLLFLASDAPLDLERRLAASGQPLRDAPLHYARFGINNVEDLVVALTLDTEGARQLALGAKLITDDSNRMAMSSVYELGRGMSAEMCGRALAAYDPLQRADSLVYRDLRAGLSFPYVARRAGTFLYRDPSIVDRLRRAATLLGQSPEGIYVGAHFYRLTGQSRRAREVTRLAIDDFPADDSLRKEFLRDYMMALARGTAPAEVAEVAASLEPSARTLLTALALAADAKWNEVAAADARLAEVPWTDAWYPEALELRAEWRTSPAAAASEHAARLADEALPMIERLAVMSPTPQLHAMRARAGLATRQPAVVVEAVANYARLVADLARAGVGSRDILGKDRPTLENMLERAAGLPGADAVRMGEVRAQIERLAASPPQ